MLGKAAIGICVLLCAVLMSQQLVTHIAWHDYRRFVSEISAGRFMSNDLAVLGPVLAKPPDPNCAVSGEETLTVLQFYAAELQAYTLSADPFLPSDQPALDERRQAALAAVKALLVCTPMDGNGWLNLAVMARALGSDEDEVARFLALSERYAPHEGWVSQRRAQLF